MDGYMFNQWAFFWMTGRFWTEADTWRVAFEAVRPFSQFDGVLGC